LLRTTWDFVRRTFDSDRLTDARPEAPDCAGGIGRRGSAYGTDFFARHARRLGGPDDIVFETLLVVQRFAGLTKFATKLNLEPDGFHGPDFGWHLHLPRAAHALTRLWSARAL
jgi:hypothetical protein